MFLFGTENHLHTIVFLSSSVCNCRPDRRQLSVNCDSLRDMANTFTSVDIAISIGRELGLFLVPGARVPGDGNCLFLALLTQANFLLFNF